MRTKRGGDRYGKSIAVVISSLLLLRAAITDIRSGKIRNRLVLTGMIAGGILQIVFRFPEGVTDWILAILLPAVLGWILFRIRAVGAGDIKLFCAIGALNGCRILWQTFAASILLAGAYGAIRLLCIRQLKEALTDFLRYVRDLSVGVGPEHYPGADRPERRIYLGVAVCIGYLLVIILDY